MKTRAFLIALMVLAGEIGVIAVGLVCCGLYCVGAAEDGGADL